jgi:molecular chaperone GrpE (heat shock protein)
MTDELMNQSADEEQTVPAAEGDGGATTPAPTCNEERPASVDEQQSHRGTDKILEELAGIRDILEKRMSRDQAKEEAFDRLYQELDALKRNKAFEEFRPLFIDLVLLYDRIQAAKTDSDSRLQTVLESLQDELKEILARREIEPITKTTEFFDPAFQRAVSTEMVASMDLNGRILRVLREGFMYRGMVFRPQDVVVGRYQFNPMISNSEETVNPGRKETE